MENINNTNELEPITETINVIEGSAGLLMPEPPDIDKSLAKLLDIKPEDLLKVPDNINDIIIRTEDIIANAIESYGFDKESVQDLLPIIEEFRSGKEIKYKDLPLSVKKVIHKECEANYNFSKEAKNIYTEALLDGIVRDSGIDRIKLDLEESLGNLDFSGLNKSISESSTYNFRYKLTEQIKKLKEEGNLEQAKTCEDILHNWEESHNLTEFMEFIKTVKIKKFEFEKINRLCNEFNFKYENEPHFHIQDIRNIFPALYLIFSKTFEKTTIDALVISFIKYCKNYSSRNIAEHTFMSYFILNILQLKVLFNTDNLDDVSISMKQSLENCLNILKNNY